MTAADKWLQPVRSICQASREAALARQAQLTKPPGSLGKLESLAIDFAGWQAREKPLLKNIAVRVFAADHGVAAEGVSAFPQAVTVEMVRNFARGGAAITVLARQHKADFAVYNLGTVAPVETLPGLHNIQLAPGSGNICVEPAMDMEQVLHAMQVGADSLPVDADLFIGGEMGVGNTTAAAALICKVLSLEARVVVGRGTGVDAVGLQRKLVAVEKALQVHRDVVSPLQILCCLGGLEIAALTGAFIRCAQQGVPVLVDGFIASAAALMAVQINPGVKAWLVFAHLSHEQGHRVLLDALAVEPLLDFDLRLGEGSGAALALPLLQSALKLHAEMATFAEAEVSGKNNG